MISRAPTGGESGARPYRPGVGAVVFDSSGRVLVARRIDTPGEAWQLPQGGIDVGEDPRAAIVRELAEEIGTEKFEIIAESADWLAYELPEEIAGRVWDGRFRGQRQKWFAVRFTGADSDIAPGAVPDPEFSDWKWVAIEIIPETVVSFKRAVYERLVVEFGPLVESVRARADHG